MPFKANNNANPTGFNGRVSTRDEFMPINSIFVGNNGDMESMNQPNFYAAALAYSGQSSFGQDASEQDMQHNYSYPCDTSIDNKQVSDKPE